MDTKTDQEQPIGSRQRVLIKEAVRASSKIMFSGESGAPVVSGIKVDAATCVLAYMHG